MEVWIYVDYGGYEGEIADGYKEKAETNTITINGKNANYWIITERERNYIYITGDKWEWLGEYKDNSIKELIEAIINGCNLQDVTEREIAIRHYVYKNKGNIYAKFRKDNQKITFEEGPREVKDPDHDYIKVRSEVLKFFEPVYHLFNLNSGNPEIHIKSVEEEENIFQSYKSKVWICVISNDFAVGREDWKAKAENDYLLFAVSEHQDVISTLRNWKNKYNPKSLYLAVHEPFFQAHKEDIEKMSSLHISFHHIPSTDPVYEAIRSGDVQKIINLILKKILTLLLHRIAHLFLPIDIDLMGICEVLRDDFEPPQSKTKEKWAEEYYNEAFNDTSPQKRFKELCEQAKNEIESMKLDDDKKQKILQMLCDNKNLGLPDKPDIAKFKDWAKNPEENPFHQWFREVMEELKRI